MWEKWGIKSGKGMYIVVEWKNPKSKGYVQMWENGRIQSEKGRYRCGRIGGFKVERVGTDVGECGGSI